MTYQNCHTAVNDPDNIVIYQGYTAMDVTYDEFDEEIQIELIDTTGRKDSMYTFLNKESSQALVDWIAEKIK